jgi:hypothetical protein
MKRLVRSLLILLGVAYAATGLVFLSTGNPGGITLGLLFLGGAALMYFLFSMQKQLGQMHELLALLAIRSQNAATAKIPERVPDAPNLGREKNNLEPAADPAVSPGV